MKWRHDFLSLWGTYRKKGVGREAQMGVDLKGRPGEKRRNTCDWRNSSESSTCLFPGKLFGKRLGGFFPSSTDASLFGFHSFPPTFCCSIYNVTVGRQCLPRGCLYLSLPCGYGLQEVTSYLYNTVQPVFLRCSEQALNCRQLNL